MGLELVPRMKDLEDVDLVDGVPPDSKTGNRIRDYMAIGDVPDGAVLSLASFLSLLTLLGSRLSLSET